MIRTFWLSVKFQKYHPPQQKTDLERNADGLQMWLCQVEVPFALHWIFRGCGFRFWNCQFYVAVTVFGSAGQQRIVQKCCYYSNDCMSAGSVSWFLPDLWYSQRGSKSAEAVDCNKSNFLVLLFWYFVHDHLVEPLEARSSLDSIRCDLD